MKRYFILGTDTDCGKTYVTCQLLAALRREGVHASAIKPVASGCVEVDGHWHSDDAQRLCQHGALAHDEAYYWRLADPVSPHIAAAKQGLSLSASAVASACMAPIEPSIEVLLIEGAGGLMVPLNEQETWVDVLVQTKWPIILVVGMRLGCINHALLTAHALQSFQLHCVGWVANCLDSQMQALSENIATLSAALPYPLLSTLPFGTSHMVLLESFLRRLS